MTTTSAIRESFENWFYEAYRKGWNSPENAFWTRDGDYGSLEVSIAYSSWQAAISAQAPSVAVGELEKLDIQLRIIGNESGSMKYAAGCVDAADAIRNLISKAGRDE